MNGAVINLLSISRQNVNHYIHRIQTPFIILCILLFVQLSTFVLEFVISYEESLFFALLRQNIKNVQCDFTIQRAKY